MAQLVSKRVKDSKQEKIINDFANQYFFSKVCRNSSLNNLRSTQLVGVDVVADGVNYDLKAQASPRYLNNPRDTFIVEISFIDKEGDRVDGWFINEEIITDTYGFIWIPQTKTGADGYIQSVNDIDKIEIMLVDRKNLHDGIVSILGNTSFMDIENELLDREAYDNADRPCIYRNGIKFVLSNDLAEAPICAVLKKDFLKKYAKGHYIVTKEKISEI